MECKDLFNNLLEYLNIGYKVKLEERGIRKDSYETLSKLHRMVFVLKLLSNFERCSFLNVQQTLRDHNCPRAPLGRTLRATQKESSWTFHFGRGLKYSPITYFSRLGKVWLNIKEKSIFYIKWYTWSWRMNKHELRCVRVKFTSEFKQKSETKKFTYLSLLTERQLLVCEWDWYRSNR